MSENDSPVSAVFELQRNAIEQTHDVVERSVEFQEDVNARVIDSVEPAREVQARSNDLVRTGVEAYFDAIEAAVPCEQAVVVDLRETISEQVEEATWDENPAV